jgi:hypothetical protein
MSPFHLLLTLLFACLTLSAPIVSDDEDYSIFPVEAPAEYQLNTTTIDTRELRERRPPVALTYCLRNNGGCAQMQEDAPAYGGSEWSTHDQYRVQKLDLGVCYNFGWVYLHLLPLSPAPALDTPHIAATAPLMLMVD